MYSRSEILLKGGVEMAWRIAVDIGGTFTDVVALEEKSGQLHLAKVPSSAEDPSVAFINSVKKITTDHNNIFLSKIYTLLYLF